jgi:hypothetical protein
MTGVLNAMVGTASIERLSITIEELGPGTNDYGDSIVASLRGNTLFFIRFDDDSNVLLLQIASGGPAQSFFKRMRVEDATPGVFQEFTSASATYTLIGGTNGQWEWSTATLWSAADIGEVKRIEVYF